MNTKLTFLSFLSFWLLLSCSTNEEPKNDEESNLMFPELNEVESKFVGIWKLMGHYDFDYICLFADKCMIMVEDDMYTIGQWDYNETTNILGLAERRYSEFNDSMSLQVTVMSDDLFAGIDLEDNITKCCEKIIDSHILFDAFKGISYKCYGIDISNIKHYMTKGNPIENGNFKCWDLTNGEENKKEIILKNIYYLKSSSIIYDGIEYKYND